ncbi:MAG: restriction endonuclease, partial [Candidatus Heimdallarchaeota archaeon]|nr:restriction endonuclease [Candidatus Heimdallarchaeota archaeon]
MLKEKIAKQERVKSGIEDILKFRGFVIRKTDDNDENIDIYAEKKSDGKIIKAIARYPKNSQIGVKTIRILGKHQQEKKINESLLIAESP